MNKGWLALILYVGTIVAANWAIKQFGIIPVGFGLEAPASIVFVGIAFTARDFVQEWLGRWWAVIAILVGAALSFVVSVPAVASGSAIAFLVSELADFAVYTPLRERGWVIAVFASNIVGLIIDSVIFLSIAFGSLQYLPGQIVGKVWMTLIAIVVIGASRSEVLSRHP